jgi:hypothetical protein
MVENKLPERCKLDTLVYASFPWEMALKIITRAGSLNV